MLCPHCKAEIDTKDSLYPPGFVPPNNLKKHSSPTGFGHCYYTGYSGRKAIYEFIPIDDDTARVIRDNEQEQAIAEDSSSIKLLKNVAWELFSSCQTSIEEVYPFFI